MLMDAFDYDLPQDRIATRPCEPRESARLLVHCRSTGTNEHLHVRDLPDVLEQGDLLVRNDTQVVQARLVGTRACTSDGRGGGKVEGLWVGQDDDGAWRLMLKAGGQLQPGERLSFDGGLQVDLVEPDDRYWRARPVIARDSASQLSEGGRTPLPPYILKARQRRGEVVDDPRDVQWYRTRFASDARAGSVAAPTAGLHLTDAVDASMRDRGVDIACGTLHVGEGTFRPVEADRLADHDMHAEHWSVDDHTMARLHQGPDGGRLIAVGTTTTRLLESLPETLPEGGCAGSTDLCIAPGHQWRRVQGLLTNFHLPRSTLLALVAALTGLEALHAIYAEAIEREYRFYSYGDAMVVLP